MSGKEVNADHKKMVKFVLEFVILDEKQMRKVTRWFARRDYLTFTREMIWQDGHGNVWKFTVDSTWADNLRDVAKMLVKYEAQQPEV